MSDGIKFAITGTEVGGVEGCVGLAIPDGSGERAWIECESTGFFMVHEICDPEDIAQFLEWAMNALHDGKQIMTMGVTGLEYAPTIHFRGQPT